ncbi:DNA damage-binding protein 2 isoform X2 [Anguilla rostrata]|uniref:DNA damage-binding protein 2 n=1 Tax=Anguilla anguilla TaxID=7936 RepID=A0A9D3MJP1_ANGAN|nr:DNA damage-binding protein 2 isoform X2 [Anguilla anguilla]KAG5848913.1 hypothetical protein ANANG_G00104500 [Anguilla anguilla]
MARKKTIDTSEPKQTTGTVSCGGRKRHKEALEDSISRKLRKKIDGQTEGGDTQPNGKWLGSQKKDRHTSIVHYIYKNTLGQNIHSQMRQCFQEPFLRSLASYRLYRTASPFDRRVTCLEWHPTHPSTLAVASKSGDIILWDYEVLKKTTFIQGKGPGDYIAGMKFFPTDSTKMFTASGDGTLSLQSIDVGKAQVVSGTPDCEHHHHNVCVWYCSLDVSSSRQVVVTGDNMGRVLLLGMEGETIWNHKLHKAKVTHAEFNPCCDWLLATASVDHTVKLWDLRSIKDKSSFLHEMPHEKAVNSAYFSPMDGSKLLTTDQYDQIRVYCSSDWSNPQKIISHPHRQFQHLTPIKATWHPMYELIVAGRYPDQRVCRGELRTIDIFDANTGALKFQLHDPNAPGIISLNKFNPMGDVLGSGMGFSILIWNREDIVNKGQDRLMREMAEETGLTGGTSSSRAQHRSHQRPGDRRGTAEKTKLKKKMESLESPGTKTKTKSKENVKPQKDKMKK